MTYKAIVGWDSFYQSPSRKRGARVATHQESKCSPQLQMNIATIDAVRGEPQKRAAGRHHSLREPTGVFFDIGVNGP
jgi:hypothetical protein